MSVSTSRLVPFVALAVFAGSTARADENGYLGLSVGAARANFASDSSSNGSSSNGSSSGGSSQLQWRFAGARQLNARLALEFGVSFAKNYDPPAEVAASSPGSHVKAVVIDGSALFHVPMSRSTRLFIAAGPAMTSARVELSNTRGRSTAIRSHRDFTTRFGAGIDIIRGNYTAVRLAVEHLQSIGKDADPPSTGSSALDTVSIGILLRF